METTLSKVTIEILGKPGAYRLWINGNLMDLTHKTKGAAKSFVIGYVRRHPEKFSGEK